MREPTFSPDGKWMWNGYNWIPAPPNHQPHGVESQTNYSSSDDNYELRLLRLEYKSRIEELEQKSWNIQQLGGFFALCAIAGFYLVQNKDISINTPEINWFLFLGPSLMIFVLVISFIRIRLEINSIKAKLLDMGLEESANLFTL